MRLYLASPLGFAESTQAYREDLHEALDALGMEVVDPWDAVVEEPLSRAGALSLGARNLVSISTSRRVLAVLDGCDVDSGVASEIGYAAALGLRCDGLRTDFRLSGECPELGVNLQVASLIHFSGGRIVRRLEDIPSLFSARWDDMREVA